MRIRLLQVVLIAAACATASAQGRFEVASVRPSEDTSPNAMRWSYANGRLTALNVSLRMLISAAYSVPQRALLDSQIVGAPSWFSSDRFDIVANAPAVDAASLEVMLRQLLEDRFRLKAHTETRLRPVYDLTLASKDGTLGPNMRRNTSDCAAVAATSQTVPQCGGTVSPGTLKTSGASMAQIVGGLQRLPNVDRIIIDRTGLTGAFDVDLAWMPERPGAADGSNASRADLGGPSLFTALREQLGLRLEPATGPVSILVIDSVSRPTAN